MVTLAIPAGYVEDVRAALVEEIRTDSHALRNVQETAAGSAVAAADRSATMRWLRGNVKLLDELLEADGDVEIQATPAAVGEVLQSMMRGLSGRLADEVSYTPVSAGAVLELTDRLCWAAEQAIGVGLVDRPAKQGGVTI